MHCLTELHDFKVLDQSANELQVWVVGFAVLRPVFVVVGSFAVVVVIGAFVFWLTTAQPHNMSEVLYSFLMLVLHVSSRLTMQLFDDSSAA